MVVRSEINEPKMRPDLPRINSAASGFFFCGMIEEPEVKASESFINSKPLLIQITISSAKRDRCVAISERQNKYSMAKSRSDTESIELAVGRKNPNSFATKARSIGNDVPAKAQAPSGHSFILTRKSSRREASRLNISK